MDLQTLSADEESTEIAGKKPLTREEQMEKDADAAFNATVEWLLNHVHFGVTTSILYRTSVFFGELFFGWDIPGVLLWLLCASMLVSVVAPFTIPLDILLQPIRNLFGLNPKEGINAEFRELMRERKPKHGN